MWAEVVGIARLALRKEIWAEYRDLVVCVELLVDLGDHRKSLQR